ncbi:TPA: exopolysaccharide biosynthesis beta-barrel protein VpsM [Vibrio cholerae]|uniref:exopolysaccharide biosynthesis beta-barrel protein VpsM n=1 Tax=Vibrio cholerae TaxID=666 RepID=UPI0011D5B450|nr:exopolysaccharide biosynthesis beta-barrel protein VpsM [Vibrio cholerae]EGR0466914.1 TetR family transcriptional regulator [Vibrio cholerae]EGR2424856.1 TetR family transcriptional regulator [Vibrio cholerae]EJL6485064.1 exopolysaccharide biosynthesis beta-barrel protein VpsM [Vibrio cholerae]EKA3898938.1 exopolysaccharide biosynthesis beta-barrel protein VpsM [Vibrio cholerae]EKF9563393.1 exopolysaccharide biosynthesis beta-barrel protein VpsM [Vibrio cholerae]
MEPIKLTSLFSASLVTLAVTYAPLGVAKPTPNPIVTESGMAVVPFLNLSTGYNDNLAKSNQQQDSSAFSVIESGVGFIVEPQSSKTQLGYRFRNGTYFSSQQDNFTDHYLDLTSDWELNSRHRIGFEYNLALAHESRGENDTTLGLDYNQYESHSANLGYGFGSTEAIGRIETNIGWQDFTYQNNRTITQYQDWDELRFNSTFYYQALPRTSFIAQVIANSRRYDLIAPGTSSKDNNHYFGYLGASWDATGKLRGNAKLGYQQKDFDAASRKDFDSFSWDVDVTYLVRTYSALQLVTNRRSTDSDGDGDAIDAATYQVNWSHNWNTQWTTEAALTRLEEDYTASNRDDETTNASLRASYDFRRWLTFELGVGRERKDSNIDSLSYSQNVYYLSVQGVM